MTKDEANKILDQVRFGGFVPDYIVAMALIVTGDLQGNYEIRTN